MVHSLLYRQVARLAAPAGAATAATTVSLLLGENTTCKASSRIAARSADAAAQYWPRRLASTQATGKASSSSISATTETVKPATASATQPFSLVAWYEKHLQAQPVRTKMVTGAFLWGVGDGVAQVVPRLVADESAQDSAKPFSYDWPRTGRAVFFGFAIHAPGSHVHFNLLEWMTHKAGVTGLGIPVFKAFMEQFVYWSWLSNSLYHGCMGAMQGQDLDQIYHRIADVLWETQKAQWVFWIPIQLLNFRFVPVRHQLNVVLLTSIVWTALLSAWYPPMMEDEAVTVAGLSADETNTEKKNV